MPSPAMSVQSTLALPSVMPPLPVGSPSGSLSNITVSHLLSKVQEGYICAFDIDALLNVKVVGLNLFASTKLPLTDIDKEWNCILLQSRMVNPLTREQLIPLLTKLIAKKPDAPVLVPNASNTYVPLGNFALLPTYSNDVSLKDTTFNTTMSLHDFVATVNVNKLSDADCIVQFSKGRVDYILSVITLYRVEDTWYLDGQIYNKFPRLRDVNDINALATVETRGNFFFITFKGDHTIMSEYFGIPDVSGYLRRLVDAARVKEETRAVAEQTVTVEGKCVTPVIDECDYDDMPELVDAPPPVATTVTPDDDDDEMPELEPADMSEPKAPLVTAGLDDDEMPELVDDVPEIMDRLKSSVEPSLPMPKVTDAPASPPPVDPAPTVPLLGPTLAVPPASLGASITAPPPLLSSSLPLLPKQPPVGPATTAPPAPLGPTDDFEFIGDDAKKPLILKEFDKSNDLSYIEGTDFVVAQFNASFDGSGDNVQTLLIGIKTGKGKETRPPTSRDLTVASGLGLRFLLDYRA